MTVLNRMDTLADDMTARITNTPAGYAGLDSDERWANEIRRLAKLRGATLLAHNYQLPAIQDVADHLVIGWDTIKEIQASHLQRRFGKP